MLGCGVTKIPLCLRDRAPISGPMMMMSRVVCKPIKRVTCGKTQSSTQVRFEALSAIHKRSRTVIAETEPANPVTNHFCISNQRRELIRTRPRLGLCASQNYTRN